MSGPTIKIAGAEIDVQELERCVAGYPEKLARIHKRFATEGEYVWGHMEDFSSVIFWGPEGVRSISSESLEDLTTLPDSAIIITGPEGGSSENYGPFPTLDDIEDKGSRWELRFSSGRTCPAQFSGLDTALVNGVAPESCCYVACTAWLDSSTFSTTDEVQPQALFEIFQVGDTSSIKARPLPDGGTRQTLERSHSVGKPVRHRTTGKLGFVLSGWFSEMPTSKCLALDGASFIVCPALSSIPATTLMHKVLWTDTPLPFNETSTYTAADLEFLDYPAWTSLVDPAQYLADLTAKQQS